MELFSVSLVIPFMKVIMTPYETMSNPYIVIFCNFFGISSANVLIVYLSVIIASFFLLKNVYLYFQYKFQYSFVYNSMHITQKQMVKSYLHKNYEFFLQADSSKIIQLVITDTLLAFLLLSFVISIFAEFLVVLILILFVFFIAPFATCLISFFLLFLLVLISKVIKPRLTAAGIENHKHSVAMQKWLSQSISGIKDVKIKCKEEYFQNKCDESSLGISVSNQKLNIFSNSTKFVIESTCMGAMFISFALILYSGYSLESIVPTFTAFALVALRLLPSFSKISSYLANISYYEPRLDNVISFFSSQNSLFKKVNLSKKTTDIKKIVKFEDNIALDNIYFRYPKSNKFILNNTSLKINKGESIGFIGESGSGKSTTADIILGILSPSKGHVCIDGFDIQDNINDYHRMIGYIPQSIFILDGSVRENVAFGENDNISDDAVWNALKLASLEVTVKSFPKGLDTELGERGLRISGGQRQRIGIARALYSEPEIIVFDEATSALDNQTENEIIDSINHLKGKVTMIIIAHRLSTIENCDHVYKISDGKISMVR